jgi:hypothetical protein
MTRYLPTLRGWIAFVLAAFAILYFPVLSPALIVESGVGTFVVEPVTPTVWITGAVLIVVCLLASVEAFRRGSRADKWFAGISVLLTIGLAVWYFALAVLSVQKSPIKGAAPNVGGRWLFAISSPSAARVGE